GRADDLVAVGAGAAAVSLLDALGDALAGGASDPTTGTITLRSLGEELARRVPDAVIQRSSASNVLLEPPPLTGASDPRLMRHSLLATERGSDAGWQIEPDDLTGVVLPGRVRIDARIARGGFGAIYRARQLAVERDVAVKVLHTDVDPGSPSGRLFVQEIQSVGRIDHPNVVRIFQADVTRGGRLFFAMELLAGRDLEQAIREEGVMSVGRALALTAQLLAGLGAAHDAGLVHADIKPANALLVARRDGERVVLVDFGLARLRSEDQPARSVGGTPAYMAPEQLEDGQVDARSDVFSAALVLVTLLTGWRRRSRDELVPPLDDLPPGALRDTVRRALAIDPAERFQTASALAAALAAIDVPTEQTRSGSRLGTRTRAWIAAAVLVALVAGGTLWRSSRSAPSTWTPPTVRVGGSGTILYGMLEPSLALLERWSATSLPILATYDLGSGGAMRTLQAGEIDLAALSARFTRPVPSGLRDAGKLLVEVAVGHDETSLFVRRENPIRTLDITQVREHLCCARGEAFRATTWAALGLTGPLASRPVTWTVFGRDGGPAPNDSTSSTLLQADTWLCDPQQLCGSSVPVDVSADEVLTRLVPDSDVLALSSRGFATASVAPIVIVDRARGKRLDGRKALWLYFAVTRDAPTPPRVCRFLDAVLDGRFAGALAAVGKAQGLPDLLRRQQRAALGLDDGSCAWRPIVTLVPVSAIEAGIVRSPIAAAVEIRQRWIDEPRP
ncbi:MAG: protein kinase, partial [Myxococcales bacterium]|nr:protein kinase [Myxococcales bacterium]